MSKNGVYEKLFQIYPDLFRERHLPATQSCMSWGIGCGEGWCQIIDELCLNLHKLFGEAGLKGADYPSVAQVKEKFGTLRFYMNFHGADKATIEKAHELISKTENLSAVTCEVCGKPGEQSGVGWIRTLCSDHAK